MVPSRRLCEQDAHPGARGRRLEPLGRVEHVQPHLRDRSPLPAAEMRQSPVSAPHLPLRGVWTGLSARKLSLPYAGFFSQGEVGR